MKRFMLILAAMAAFSTAMALGATSNVKGVSRLEGERRARHAQCRVPAVHQLAFVGDKLISASRDGAAFVWNAQTLHQESRRAGSDSNLLACSSDGKLAVFQEDELVVRDRAAGKTLTLKDKRLSPRVAAFSPDNRSLAVCTRLPQESKWNVSLIDLESGKERWNFAVNHESVKLAFSPNGQFLACGSAGPDRTKLLSCSKGRTVWEVGNDGSHALVFAIDGRSLCTVGRNNSAAVLEAATGRSRFDIKTGEMSSYNSYCLAPDGSRLFAGSDIRGGRRGVAIWDIGAKKEAGRLGDFVLDQVTCLTMAVDGTLATGQASGHIRLWDSKTCKELPASQGPAGPTMVAHISPDGRIVYTLEEDNFVRAWDVKQRRELWTIRLGYSPINAKLVFSRDGKTVAVLDVEHKTKLLCATTGKIEGTLESKAAAVPLGFSRDGALLVTQSAGEIQVWKMAPLKQVRSFKVNGSCFGFTANGDKLFTHTKRDVFEYSAETGKELRQVSLGEPVHMGEGERNAARLSSKEATSIRCRLSPDGRYVEVHRSYIHYRAPTGSGIGYDHKIDILGTNWAVGPQQQGDHFLDLPLEFGKSEGSPSVFSPCGQYRIHLVHSHGYVHLLPKNTKKGKFETYEVSPCFSGDGKFFVTGGRDLSIRLMESATLEVRRELKGLKASIRSLALSADGTTVALSTTAGTVIVWDLAK